MRLKGSEEPGCKTTKCRTHDLTCEAAPPASSWQNQEPRICVLRNPDPVAERLLHRYTSPAAVKALDKHQADTGLKRI